MRLETMMRACLLVWASGALLYGAAGGADATELMKKALSADLKNQEALRSYVWQDTTETIRENEKHTLHYVWVITQGVRVHKLIEKDGKPLAAGDARKEAGRIEQAIEKRRKQSAAERAAAEEENRRNHAEILKAFRFELAGEETVEGRPAWIVNAIPRSDYKPPNQRMQLLAHLRATVWVDEKDFCWGRLEAEAQDAVSIGFGLARLEKGARLYFEQIRMTDGTWVPHYTSVQARGRIALVKKLSLDTKTTTSHIEKVSGEHPPLEASH